MEAELGGKAADLATVSPGEDKRGHASLYEDAGDTVSPAEERKAKRLRAILRAPELVQQLYRDDMLTQKTVGPG